MKVFIFLIAINSNLFFQIDTLRCIKFIGFGCGRTTTPKTQDVNLRSSADNKDDQTSVQEQTTLLTIAQQNPKFKVRRKSDETPDVKEFEVKMVEQMMKNKGTKGSRKDKFAKFATELKKGVGSKVNYTITVIKSYMVKVKGKVEKGVHLRRMNKNTKGKTAKARNMTTALLSKLKKMGQSCFRNIGCFSAKEFENVKSRPISMLPQSPERIKPVFQLYTTKSKSIAHNLNYNPTVEQLRDSTFNPSHRTALIVHGFQSGHAMWMENLKDFILSQSNDTFNVIFVVWEKGAKVPMYSVAVANTRVVGACIAYFIEQLCKTFNVTNDMFYLIGHSLGAHTVGYAGKRLTDPKVARIEALDPSGVDFQFYNTAKRLDSSDATIVSVIHTDGAHLFSEGFGSMSAWGHFDFYPNGGTWQPGCPPSHNIQEKLDSKTTPKDITCSHSRAYLLIDKLEKPDPDCRSVAYECESYETFLEGRCADCSDHKCQLMGIDINNWLTQKPTNQTIEKKFYINTSDNNTEDYCLQHYQFALHVSDDSDSCSGFLRFYLRFKLSNNMSKEIEFNRTMTQTVQNKTHTLLANFGYKINEIYSLVLSWQQFKPNDTLGRVNKGDTLKIPYIEINFMSSINESIREQYSSVLCATEPEVYNNGTMETEYSVCNSTELTDRAFDMDPEKLVALESAEYIHSVDPMKANKLFHKIETTRIKKEPNEII